MSGYDIYFGYSIYYDLVVSYERNDAPHQII